MSAIVNGGTIGVLKASQDIYNRTALNLKGPHYKNNERGPQTGKIPIPRRSGNLARGLELRKQNRHEWRVFSNPNVADYAKHVHRGRQYLGIVVRQRTNIAVATISKEIFKQMRQSV